MVQLQSTTHLGAYMALEIFAMKTSQQENPVINTKKEYVVDFSSLLPYNRSDFIKEIKSYLQVGIK